MPPDWSKSVNGEDIGFSSIAVTRKLVARWHDWWKKCLQLDAINCDLYKTGEQHRDAFYQYYENVAGMPNDFDALSDDPELQRLVQVMCRSEGDEEEWDEFIDTARPLFSASVIKCEQELSVDATHEFAFSVTLLDLEKQWLHVESPRCVVMSKKAVLNEELRDFAIRKLLFLNGILSA